MGSILNNKKSTTNSIHHIIDKLDETDINDKNSINLILIEAIDYLSYLCLNYSYSNIDLMFIQDPNSKIENYKYKKLCLFISNGLKLYHDYDDLMLVTVYSNIIKIIKLLMKTKSFMNENLDTIIDYILTTLNYTITTSFSLQYILYYKTVIELMLQIKQTYWLILLN